MNTPYTLPLTPQFYNRLYEIRKALHKVPELAFQEFKTQEIIKEVLNVESGALSEKQLPHNEQLHTPHSTLLTPHFFTPTGLLYEYSHGTGDYILFRADMDALPITEETDCDFRSTHQGIMHACGHDIHITILIGLIHYVVENKLPLNLLFLFQPAEEGHGGAETIIKTGIFDKYKIKAAYALHVSGQYPVGTIGVKSGIIFGIPQEFDIEITGTAGHCATPQKGKDAFMAAISFIEQMNSLIAKKFPAQEPVIFHIGKVSAGTVRNITPAYCKLEGTTRCIKKEVKQEINKLLEKVAKSIENSHEVQVKVNFLCSYDPVINDEKLVNDLIANLPPDIKHIEVDYAMVGEDFGFFSGMFPSVLFWLGSKVEGRKAKIESRKIEDAPRTPNTKHQTPTPDLHSSKFLPDETCIPVALEIYKSILGKVRSEE